MLLTVGVGHVRDRGAADGALEQMADAVLEHSISRQADRVPEAFGFEELVNPGQCKRSISSEVAPKQPVSITSDNRPEHVAPFVGAVHVAGAKRAPLQIAELVEHEQRMGTSKNSPFSGVVDLESG